MKRMYAVLVFLCLAAPALADVTVGFPVDGSVLMSPFAVQASANACQSQSITAMAYSLDSGQDTIVKSSAIAVQLAAVAGPHILHVKSWGNRGALCSAVGEHRYSGQVANHPRECRLDGKHPGDDRLDR